MTIFAIITFSVVVLSLWTIYKRFNSSTDFSFPHVARSKNAVNPVASALAEGYRKFSKTDKPFYITYWTRKLLILPPKYLNDLRRANRDHVSFQPGINHVLFQYKWLDGVIKTELNQIVLMKGMNPQLPKLSNHIIEEAAYAISKSVGNDANGKEIGLVDFAMETSLRSFSRVLGGKSFARDEACFTAFKAWSMGGMITAMITLYIPTHTLRHTLGWPLTMYQKHVRQRQLHAATKRHVVRRMQEYESNEKQDIDGEIDTLKMALNLLSDHALREKETTAFVDLLAAQLWQLTWAGAQSPSMSLANMIAQILETPEHADILREEAKMAVEHQGWSDAMLLHMPIMDSFIREVHRLRPTLGVRVERKVMNKPFTFSDGLTLPTNTFFAFPGAPASIDPDLIDDPLEFDIHRFVKLTKRDRESEEGEGRWAASQAGITNLAFGYGNHVCPGRFLAVRGLKIIFARLLLDYEIEWAARDGREEPMVFEGLQMPSPGRKIVVKRRSE